MCKQRNVRRFSNLQAYQAALKGTIQVWLYIRDTETVSHVDPSAVRTLLHVKKTPASSPIGFFALHIDKQNGNPNSHFAHKRVADSLDAWVYKKYNNYAFASTVYCVRGC